MQLSFIIPVYNVEAWIERCLNSVLAQQLPATDYEVVLVDDGSTDKTIATVEAFFARPEAQGVGWQLLRQDHQGPSAARNNGLRAAKGDYVWWIDADDFLEPACAPRLLQRAQRDQLDILGFGLYIAEADGSKEVYPIADHTEGRVVDGATFQQKVGMAPSPWSAIYSRQFLLERKLTYVEGVCAFEDQDFTMRAFFLGRRCAFDATVVYNYFQREGSIMKSENPKKTDDLVSICTRLYKFAHKNTASRSASREFFENRINFLFSQALANLCRCGIFDFPGDLKALPFYPLKINDSESKKLRYKYRLINVSVPLYIKLYGKFANKPVVKPGLRQLRTK